MPVMDMILPTATKKTTFTALDDWKSRNPKAVPNEVGDVRVLEWPH